VLAFAVHTIVIPITLGVAILRYRLFDIDLVLSHIGFWRLSGFRRWNLCPVVSE
jgi:hypothetical protein